MVVSGVTSVAAANSRGGTAHHTSVPTTGTHTPEHSLAGRVAERTRIGDTVAATAAGSGSTVFIDGSAGSGKTRLLEDAESVASREGTAIVAIRCTGLAPGRAHGPVIEALTIRDASPGSLGPEPGHDELIAAFAELAGAQAVLVTVDDFQFADGDTQQLVFALRRLTERLPIALIVAATDWPPATTRLVESARHHLELRPLGDDDLTELATSMIGCPPGTRLAGLLATTGGNPYLTVRLIEALDAEGRLCDGEVADASLPVGFCRVVQRFLGDLSDGACELLRGAAVLGCTVRVDRLAAMLDVPLTTLIDPLDELQRGGVLQDRGADGIVFAQPIVRQAIHRSTNAAQRLDLSARAALQLELADDRRALELYDLVCDRAATGDRDRLAVGHVRTLVRSGRYRDAEAVAGSLGPAVEPVDAHELRANLTEIRYHRARWNELIADIEPWLEDRPGSVESDRLTANLAAAHAGLGHTDTATDHARGVLERQGAAGDPIARTIAYQVLARVSAGTAAAAEVVELAHRAVREAERMGTWESFRRHPHTTYATALADAGRPDEALATLAAGRALADRLTTAWDDSAFCAAAALIAVRLGRWQEAETHIEHGLDHVQQSGAVVPGVDLHSARMVMAIGRGDLDTASASLDAALHLLGDRPARSVPGLCRSWGALREALDDLDGARARLTDVWEARPGSLWINAGPALIRVLLAADGASSIGPAEIAAAVAERAAETGAPWIAAQAARCRGLADRDAGQLRVAADRFAAIDERPDELECLIDAIRIAADPDDAKALRARAQQRSAALGAGDRVAALPAVTGAEPPRPVRRRAARPVSGWGSLTVAEERVARLVAQGHSNAEAGAELFVSSRTVESHLRRIFAKLEIRKRVELAVLVSQLADH